MPRSALLALPLFLVVLLFGAIAHADIVTLSHKGSHYEVTVDLSNPEVTRFQAGAALGSAIRQAVGNIEPLMDGYLAELCQYQPTIYQTFLSRAQQLRQNVPQDLADELDGLADSLCSATTNTPGDGKLSADELWLLNLAAEALRLTQCSAVGVLPEASASGNCMLVRNLDWDGGTQFQLSYLQAVTVYTLPQGRSLTLIGFLGTVNCLSGFNSDGVFGAILDSGTGRVPYTAENKRAYTFDLRQALEDAATDSVDVLAAALQAQSTQYTYGHLIFMGDPQTVMVLENDLLPGGANLRSAESAPLYHEWNVPGTIGAVNCFMLPASTDNSGSLWDTARWDSQQRLLLADGATHTWQDLKDIGGYGPGEGTDGSLYISTLDSLLETQQIIVFEPATRRLDVAFHPVGRGIGEGEAPTFTTVNPAPQPPATPALQLLLGGDGGTP